MKTSRLVSGLAQVALVITLSGFGGRAAPPSEREPAQAPPASPSSSSSSASSFNQEANSVWVSRPDGGQSCSPKSGQALDQVAQELKSAGITVLESRKGNDGKMRAQMCGIPTGSFNSYRISRGDLPKAQALGFQKI